MSQPATGSRSGLRRALGVAGPLLVALVVGLWLYRVFALHEFARGRAVGLVSIPAGVPLEYLFDNTLGKPRAQCAPERGGLRCIVYEDALQVPERSARGWRWKSTLTIRRGDADACRASRWRPELTSESTDTEIVTPADPCAAGWTLHSYWYRATPW